MNWLKDIIPPKLRELVGVQKEIPDNLWHKCPACNEMIFHRDLEKEMRVCRHCGHHLRLNAKQRLDMMFDEGEYQTIELKNGIADPLKFRDRRKYTDRLKEAQNATGEKDALMVAHGKMGGMSVVVAAFNFQFMGGSMGISVGDGLLAASRLAVAQDAPLIVVPSSGGARMQEGILSLMQMPRSTIAVDELREAGLPYIVVLADPTTGGVTASFAMLGDVAIAEKGAVIGFAGARVIEQTIREKLPDDFQRAEYLLDHGMVDMVVTRPELRGTLIRVLGLLRNQGPAADVLAIPSPDDPGVAEEALEEAPEEAREETKIEPKENPPEQTPAS
ncbi:MAG: acetyl-CoA carboxylase carboxyltransferase subunit beta [Rhodospirillales bacterium]|nr:acetyl-CoA carboxylase carboxyltransferase subunit beta [Rhodospirillales bacterium]